jgi:hypothetical protein
MEASMKMIEGITMLSIQLGTPANDADKDTVRRMISCIDDTCPIRAGHGLYRAKSDLFRGWRLVYTYDKRGNEVALALLKRGDDTYERQTLERIESVARKLW